MVALILLVLFVLLALTIWDIKTQEFPAFITTTMILVLFFLRPENMIYGLMAFLFGLLIYEMFSGRYISGMGDLKVMGIIGMMVPSINIFGIFMLLVVGIGAIFMIIMSFLFKGKSVELPFLPVLFVVYVLLAGIWLT